MRGRTVIAALVALALLGGSVGAGRAAAGLNIDFNLVTPPQLVAVPGTPVAYAPALPANYFFYNGQYYLFANDAWFVAGGFNGPWFALQPAYVPGALLSVPVGYYRSAPRQWQHWQRAQPPRWTPVWGHRWPDHGRPPGRPPRPGNHWPGGEHGNHGDHGNHNNHGDSRNDQRRDRH